MRRHSRYPQNGKVRVSWEGSQRQQNSCVAKIVDISIQGMQISCPEEVPARAIIQFQFLDKFFKGSASVRSCTRHGLSYRVGMEFCGGLQWTAPSAEEPAYTE